MTEVLNCLKKHGQRLDLEIAAETRLPIEAVRRSLDELRANGTIITCSLTRFDGGNRIDALECRMSGYSPKPAPGRKAGVKTS